jgi:hypothetical protein
MGSPERYLRFARERMQWPKRAEDDDDRRVAIGMARAWMNVARADYDVAREAPIELPPKRTSLSLNSGSQQLSRARHGLKLAA